MPSSVTFHSADSFPAESMASLVSKIGDHPDFEAAYNANPRKALQSLGVSVPAGFRFPSGSPFRRNDDNDDPGIPPSHPPVHPPPAPPPVRPTVTEADVTVGVNGWGIVFTLSHNAAQDLAFGSDVVSTIVGIVAAAFPPAALVAGLVAGFIALNAQLIRGVDVGNGVFLTVPWLLPGVVIPGSR